MNNKNISFFFFFVIFGVSAYAMNPNGNKSKSSSKSKRTHTVPTTSFEFLSSFEHNFPYEMSKPYQDPEHSRIASELFVYNQKHVTKTMNQAAQRKDTKVHLTVGPHSANNMDLYEVTTLKRKVNAHGKMTVGLKGSPQKTISQKGRLYIGSGNATNSTWKNAQNKKIRFNLETGISTNDPELAEQAYQMVISGSPIKHKTNVITKSPEKPSLYSSKHTNLNKSLAQRLFTLAQDENDNRAAFIQTMNINDEEVVEAAIKAKKSGAQVELIANHTALTKYGTPLLQELNKAEVPVHIFYPDKDSRAIQHSKAVDIVKGKQYMHLENTGNLTEECGKQTNYTLLLPNNKNVATQSIDNFEKVKEKCKSLPVALELKEKDNKEKAEKKALKRKMEKEAQSASIQKKQKTSNKELKK